MTPPIPDDELRAMLESRADRVAPDAERSVLAGFRAAVRGAPDGKGGFAVIPQALSSRNARLPWGLAAVGMVAVVAIALLGGRLSTTTEVAGSPAIAVASGVPASIPDLAAGSPEVVVPSAVTGDGGPVSEDQLRAAVMNGSLAGRVIVIDGDVRWTNVSCAGSGTCRVPIPVGLESLPIAADASFGTATADGEPPGPYLYVADGAGLTYYGTTADGLASPISVPDLVALGEPVPSSDVHLVDGWLIAGGILTDDKEENVVAPRPDHAVRAAVAGERWKGGQIPGPFLVRPFAGHWMSGPVCLPDVPCPGPKPGWQVVAQVADRPAIRVSMSSLTGDPGDLSGDDLRGGLADGSLTGRVIAVDGGLQIGQIPCMRLSECLPSARLLDGVQVTVDPTIEASVGAGVLAGPHVFIGDGVGLRYLGTMTGALDAPVTAVELPAVPPSDETAVRFAEGIVGSVPCLGPSGACPSTQREQWLSVNGNETVRVPVLVPETIEPPATPNRYLLRATVRPSCAAAAAPSDGSCVGAAMYEWTLVAAVGDEPILRVVLP
jgi:hypothetical protein